MTDPTRTTRLAVELLTVWLDRGSPSTDAARYMLDRMNDPDVTPAEMVVGQLNLAELLLLQLAMRSGGENGDELRATAHEILQHLSPRLPEQ